jgi:regulator of cell morphogenesis and NO signaling
MSKTSPTLCGSTDTDLRSRLGYIDLVRLILAYHQAHLRRLGAALALARAVEGREAEGFPSALADHLARMLAEMAAHQAREAHLMMPRLRLGGAPWPTLGQLQSEHASAEADIRRLTDLTGGYDAPAQACSDWRALYALCREYEREFREHVELEESIVFARFSGRPGVAA